MTALTNGTSVPLTGTRERVHPLMGFGPFFRKEISEWWNSRRAGVVFVVTSLLVAMVTIAPWLQATFPPEGSAPPAGLSLDPTMNLVGANWDQWLTFISIFAAMSLLVGERDKGTLAWSLSKPLSRDALLLAKWTAGTLMYVAFGLLLPLVVGTFVATVVYGALPDFGALAVMATGLAAVPAFYIGLSLALGTRISSAAAVAGIGVGVTFLPQLAGLISGDVAAAMPSAIGAWAVALAAGATVPAHTPVGWAVSLAVIGLVARRAFARSEL